MKFFNNLRYFFFIIFLATIIISCMCKRNYIIYYNRVYEINSLYSVEKDTLKALRKSRKLFRRYEPKNQERVDEFEKFITLSDKQHKNFGGKKSLYKLIPLVAPYWKYWKQETDLFKLYRKYGIDSLEVEQKVSDWKKSLNRQLVDSFSIAFIRDQQNRQHDSLRSKRKGDDEKNTELLMWTFKDYGYPSMQKIGLYGNKEVFMPMGLLLNHMAESKQYDYFKIKLLDYIKSGELPPIDYMEMVDKHNWLFNKETKYGLFSHHYTVLDTAKINLNRKLIGFHGLKNRGKMMREDKKKER